MVCGLVDALPSVSASYGSAPFGCAHGKLIHPTHKFPTPTRENEQK